MKIFLVTSVPLAPPWDQGDKNFAYMLTQSLGSHSFRVLTAQDAPAPPGDNLELTPLYRHRRPGWGQKARVAWSLFRDGGQASDLYHFVYRPYLLSSVVARLLPDVRRRPTLHTVPATTADQPLTANLFFADRLVALSRYGQEQLRALGFDAVTFIPTAIEVKSWARLSQARDQYKSELGVAGCPTLLFPSHYGPGYGADVLLEALPSIVRAVPNVRILMACRPRGADDADRERQVRDQLKTNGLVHHVRFFRTVPDMRRLIGASDLTLLPLQTMRDKVDIPTTLLESMAAGTPIVISDLAPMNELLHDNPDAGRLVPTGDSVALAENVVELLSDEKLRARLARCGQQMMWTQYDMNAVARQYDQLYREMVL